MTRRRWLALGAVVLLAALLALSAGGQAGGPSVGSRDDAGLKVAWRYLEARGWPVHAWERPLGDLPAEPGVLVVAMPLLREVTRTDDDALRRWLLVGGSVVLLGDGTARAPADQSLLLALGVEAERPEPPAPGSWREVDDLAWNEVAGAATDGAAWGAAIRSRRPRWQTRPEPEDRALFPDADGRALVTLRPLHRGHLLVVDPGRAWGNRDLLQADNAVFLEAALGELGGRRGVWFDKWHQGRTAPELLAEATPVLPFDLLILHLVVVYAAVVWALGRRFGQPRDEIEPPRGSVERDLGLLAALHARSGHADQAGRRLLAAVRALARRGAPDLPQHFDGGPRELLALARRVGKLQQEHRT